MPKIPANCRKVAEFEVLQRSSQVLATISGHAFVFGGELRPREPRDNDVHVLGLQGGGQKPSTSVETTTSHRSPSARVGSASSTLNGRLYLFSGRGGIAMAPIEEDGTIWEFDPAASNWSALSPVGSSSPPLFPPARSYHCMANDGSDTIYLHAGCPEQGRLCDLWAFSLASKQWKQLAPAPDPPRGGSSIAFADGRLYRMNGFDGKTEQGGSVDIYSPETDSWTSHGFTADGKNGPEPRSVSALLPVRIQGRQSLVTLFGERDPSALGHQGAGKMLGDVWAFDLEDRTWTEVEISGDALPAPRGWFAADTYGDQIVVQGGLDESNKRLGDLWMLSF